MGAWDFVFPSTIHTTQHTSQRIELMIGNQGRPKPAAAAPAPRPRTTAPAPASSAKTSNSGGFFDDFMSALSDTPVSRPPAGAAAAVSAPAATAAPGAAGNGFFSKIADGFGMSPGFVDNTRWFGLVSELKFMFLYLPTSRKPESIARGPSANALISPGAARLPSQPSSRSASPAKPVAGSACFHQHCLNFKILTSFFFVSRNLPETAAASLSVPSRSVFDSSYSSVNPVSAPQSVAGSIVAATAHAAAAANENVSLVATAAAIPIPLAWIDELEHSARAEVLKRVNEANRVLTSVAAERVLFFSQCFLHVFSKIVSLSISFLAG
jgi:hypothetical protein